MNIVIGSGPAGVSATLALLEKNKPVTMVDVGMTIESKRQEELDALKHQPLEDWDPSFIQKIRGRFQLDPSGIPMKSVLGSDFHYAGTEQIFSAESVHMRHYSSFALGGLSNAWGGAILPYSDHDMAGWPIRLADLIPHYKMICSLFHFSGHKDDLAEFFPLFTDTLEDLRLNPQSQFLLQKLQKHRNKLNARGVYFGRSRLALRTKTSSEGPGCVYCGLCLYGCPYDLIYSTKKTVEQFKTNPNFTYLSDIQIDRIEEKPDGAILHGRTFSTQNPLTLNARKVFLGAGAISSTRIVMRSLSLKKQSVRIKTSQHFILPMILFKKMAPFSEQGINSLTQIFIEIFSKKNPRDNLHLQVYTHNALFSQTFSAQTRGYLSFLQPFLEKHIFPRLLVVQGYLHSDVSPSFTMTLEKESGKICVTSTEKSARFSSIVKHLWNLIRFALPLGTLPLLPMLKISPCGKGSHLGASFPMKASPNALESNSDGQIAGLPHVHLIDASIFTSIPPTTVTLAVMANAHRIASRAS